MCPYVNKKQKQFYEHINTYKIKPIVFCKLITVTYLILYPSHIVCFVSRFIRCGVGIMFSFFVVFLYMYVYLLAIYYYYSYSYFNQTPKQSNKENSN